MALPSVSDEWNLRTEILEVSHRWPQVFFAFLLGCLLGWGAAFIFPSPYRAQTELYVGYNGDAIYRNADDYKNWQLGELEAYVVSNDVLGEALNRLRRLDPYWQDVTNDQLKPHLYTYWRNAGRWRLVVEWPGEQRAGQLSRTWTQVILEKTHQAVLHGGTVLSIESQLDALSRSESDLRLRNTQLNQVYTALKTWRDAQITDQSAPPEVLDRWRLQFLTSSASGLLPVELDLVAQIPPPDAPAVDYVPAVDQALTALEGELAIANQQAADLTDRRAELMEEWKDESASSHSLTANLIVESLTTENGSVRPERPTSQMSLVGGVLGLLVWGLYWLGRPFRKAIA